MDSNPFGDVMAKYQKNRIGSTSIDQSKQQNVPKLIQPQVYVNPKNITIANHQPLQPSHMQTNSNAQALAVQKAPSSHLSGSSKDTKSRNPAQSNLLGSKT